MNNAIKLYVQLDTADIKDEDQAWMDGADGFIVRRPECTISELKKQPPATVVLQDSDPAKWLDLQDDRTCFWSSSEGLDAAAALRDEWPELIWVPHLSVYRPSMSYRFSGKGLGEGFSFYMPDTSAIRAWRVTDGEQSLLEAVEKAQRLGFESLWLHSLDAAQAGRGLELEMLDRTSGSELDIWISGGVTQAGHLSNLLRSGGASGVVVGSELARQAQASTLCGCLKPVAEPVTAEVNFSHGQSYSS